MKRRRKSKNQRRAAALRAARKNAELTQQQLAQRMGLSDVTVTHAEAGSDPKFSTLKAFLRELPELSPHDLIGPESREQPHDRESMWNYYRDLIGLEADRCVRKTVIKANGDHEDHTEYRGLRSIRNAPGEVRLLHGLEGTVFEGAPQELLDLAAGSRSDPEGDEIRARVVEKKEGRFVQQIVLPPKVAQEGSYYRWSRVRPGLPLSRQESAARRGFDPDDTVHGGIKLPPVVPVRELQLEVQFPPGFWPVRAYAKVWPEALPPDPDARDLAPLIHPKGLRVRKEPSRGRVRCNVTMPLVGMCYNLGWELP